MLAERPDTLCAYPRGQCVEDDGDNDDDGDDVAVNQTADTTRRANRSLSNAACATRTLVDAPTTACQAGNHRALTRL